jgi:hypothetical protein
MEGGGGERENDRQTDRHVEVYIGLDYMICLLAYCGVGTKGLRVHVLLMQYNAGAIQ